MRIWKACPNEPCGILTVIRWRAALYLYSSLSYIHYLVGAPRWRQTLLTTFFGIVQFGIMAVLLNVVSNFFRGLLSRYVSTLVRSGVWPRRRVGDVRRRVWRVERHPLHVGPESAKPLTAHWLSDIIIIIIIIIDPAPSVRPSVTRFCISVGARIGSGAIPETRPLFAHANVSAPRMAKSDGGKGRRECCARLRDNWPS